MRAVDGAGRTALRRELELWRRKHGGKGRRIPERLWTAAVRIARHEGVQATARALRLDPGRLKARMGLPATEGAATFIEVPAVSLGSGRLVELVGRGGEQMRIHLSGTSSAELVELARTFWNRQS